MYERECGDGTHRRLFTRHTFSHANGDRAVKEATHRHRNQPLGAKRAQTSLGEGREEEERKARGATGEECFWNPAFFIAPGGDGAGFQSRRHAAYLC